MSSHEVVWYVRHQGKSGGPYAAANIGKALQGGKLSPDSEVRRADHDQWCRLSDVEPFASMLRSPASQPHQQVVPQAPSNHPDWSVPAATGSLPVSALPPSLPTQAAIPPIQVLVAPQTPAPTLSGMLETRHTMPGSEHTFWEGRCSIYYYAARFVWGGLWLVLWLMLAENAANIEHWIKGATPQIIADAADALPEGREALAEAEKAVAGKRFAQYVSWGFLLLAFWALWRLVCCVLVYFNTYYIFTSQRIKIRKGILSRKFQQVELFRLRDFVVQQTIWGRIFGYTHIEINSGDRLIPWFRFEALPGGLRTAERLRDMMQQVRSQSGAVAVSE